MLITKADGTQEEFSEKKLLASIKRAGIPEDTQATVLMHVKSKLYHAIPTSEIYQHITEYLGKSQEPFAKSRFTIKEALQELGPTGYPFEDYVARLLQEMGYQTQTRVIVQGTCISHEIDVIATKGREKILVEAKFHNSNTLKTDVQVAMYTWARLQDVKERGEFTSAMLITNTKLTTDAITYGQCVGMSLIGWSYPEQDGLRDLIEKYHLFPVTALTSLTLGHKEQLLSSGITLCKDICADPHKLDVLPLPEGQKDLVHREAQFVCRI